MQVLALVAAVQLPLAEPRAGPRPRPVLGPFRAVVAAERRSSTANRRTSGITEPLVDGVHAVERFVGDLFSPIFGGPVAGGARHQKKGPQAPAEGYAVPAYEPPPQPAPRIPCHQADYAHRRSFGALGGKDKNKGPDDCGVYDATDNGYGFQEDCEYVHETVFVTKYKTECSKTYSTQCQTSYRTECSTTLSKECRTEYQEECTYADTEECITVDRPSYNNVCTTQYVQDCEGGGYTNTYEAPPPCATVPKQVCSQVAEYTKETECTKVPKRSCVTSPREVCGEVPKQDCKLVPTSTNCKDIPEKLCRQRAYQYPESTTRQVCGLGPTEDGGTEGEQKGKNGRK